MPTETETPTTETENNSEQQNDQQDPTDSQQQGSIDNNQQAVTNSVDFRALYLDAIQHNNRKDSELQQLREQANKKPEQPRQEYTDDDLSRLGTVPVIRGIVEQALRGELGDTLGDMKQMNAQFKRGQAMNTAEQTFFSQYPQLAQYREQLGPATRNLLDQNNYDPNNYGQIALASIGQLVAMNNFQPPQQQNTQTNTQTNTRGTPPVNNGRNPAPSNAAAPRLSELERSGMRKIGMDPNKKEDVVSFLAIVNADDGFTMDH